MKGNTFFNLIERNKAMPPKIHSHGLKSFGFAFRVVRIVGARFRVGGRRKHSATSSLAF